MGTKATHNVAWVPAAMAEALGVTLQNPDGPGEFHVTEGEPGEQTITDEVAHWVEANPDDPTDTSGAFKPYKGDPADYVPTVDPDGQPFDGGERQDVAI